MLLATVFKMASVCFLNLAFRNCTLMRLTFVNVTRLKVWTTLFDLELVVFFTLKNQTSQRVKWEAIPTIFKWEVLTFFCFIDKPKRVGVRFRVDKHFIDKRLLLPTFSIWQVGQKKAINFQYCSEPKRCILFLTYSF